MPSYFCTIPKDSKNPDYQDTMEWLSGMYIPETFEPSKVRFDNPKRRLKKAFSD
jgi:hypothetical protein